MWYSLKFYSQCRWWPRPGWPDWALFHQLGYFWRLIKEIAQKMVKPLATNLLHFHLNKLFKMVSNLALFCLANYLATIKKIGWFFPNHLVTLTTTEAKSWKLCSSFNWKSRERKEAKFGAMPICLLSSCLMAFCLLANSPPLNIAHQKMSSDKMSLNKMS